MFTKGDEIFKYLKVSPCPILAGFSAAVNRVFANLVY